jgi:hypothetical protein
MTIFLHADFNSDPNERELAEISVPSDLLSTGVSPFDPVVVAPLLLESRLTE